MIPTIEIFQQTDGTWSYRCSCGARGHSHQTQQLAEDAVARHITKVHPPTPQNGSRTRKEKPVSRLIETYEKYFVNNPEVKNSTPVEYLHSIGVEYGKEEEDHIMTSVLSAAAATIISARLEGREISEGLAGALEGVLTLGILLGVHHERARAGAAPTGSRSGGGGRVGRPIHH